MGSFCQQGLSPPTNSQIYEVYAAFDPGRSMQLSTCECLCLVDALARATFHGEPSVMFSKEDSQVVPPEVADSAEGATDTVDVGGENFRGSKGSLTNWYVDGHQTSDVAEGRCFAGGLIGDR